MGKTEDSIEAYKTKRDKIKQMGDPKAIEKRHKAEQWSARERIDHFFDPGTFTEIGLFVKHRATHFGMDKREIPAEGVITGYGKVNGRPVVAIAELNKMERIYEAEGSVTIDNRTLIINVRSEKSKTLTERLMGGERTSGDNGHQDI